MRDPHYTAEGSFPDPNGIDTKIYCCDQCGAAVVSRLVHNWWHQKIEKMNETTTTS